MNCLGCDSVLHSSRSWTDHQKRCKQKNASIRLSRATAPVVVEEAAPIIEVDGAAVDIEDAAEPPPDDRSAQRSRAAAVCSVQCAVCSAAR
jgi:hypothetical protein